METDCWLLLQLKTLLIRKVHYNLRRKTALVDSISWTHSSQQGAVTCWASRVRSRPSITNTLVWLSNLLCFASPFQIRALLDSCGDYSWSPSNEGSFKKYIYFGNRVAYLELKNRNFGCHSHFDWFHRQRLQVNGSLETQRRQMASFFFFQPNGVWRSVTPRSHSESQGLEKWPFLQDCCIRDAFQLTGQF